MHYAVASEQVQGPAPPKGVATAPALIPAHLGESCMQGHAAVPVQAMSMLWVAAAAAAGGIIIGLLVAKAAQNYFAAKEFDLKQIRVENAQLRVKVGCLGCSRRSNNAS